ncbi:SDR family oxidoreductase [Variovorax sp. J2P1-59]|uniref:SDR family NAD(P)-dependent oxidoreductase n=1 Tax=Variovorax flavidus TaxID=3053501 RepID=UPI002574F1DC|nr:SDR family oxidoreductase [Variovorax sp. J2P1-59]MDM0078445.1 SDR family oxidoreductase [Variovorax sp. J2P1-59]
MKPTDKSTPIALVTGASSGIGAIYADRLARRGHDLVLVARDVAKLTAIAARIRSDTGRHVELLPADLTVRDDVLRVEKRLLSDDRIELLVNNAGVGATSALIDSDADRLDDMIQLNVTALTRLTRAVAVGMARRGKGAIINIASIVAVAPELLNGTYGGSKAFVLAFTQSLDHELAPKGIQVQAVLPGATSTDFWNVAGVPVEHLPSEIVMRAEEMVDAALVGFDRRELVTIPSLPDIGDWERFDAARKALGPNLSRSSAAKRYQTAHDLEVA